MIEKMIDAVIQGDCIDVMQNIPDESIDMILCDLPYGTTQNKWDSVIDLDKLWVHYERIKKAKQMNNSEQQEFCLFKNFSAK